MRRQTEPGVIPVILDQDFYLRDTKIVAQQLLGKILFHKKETGEIVSGRIVETEAYLGVDDPAAHTFGDRKTTRTASMYLSGGHSYVYLIYGMYYCLNFVTREENTPQAVLIRALEPVHLNEEKIHKKNLDTNGPGKLCRHLDITKKQNGLQLWKKRSGLWVEEDSYKLPAKKIVTTTRVGVDYAGEAAKWPLRYYVKDSPWVSRR